MKQKEYFEYLNNITIKGKLYRQHIIYPSINKWVEGPVLDIGCGLGQYLSTRNDIWGVDINKYCVNHCSKIYPGRVSLMEPNILPFSDNKFKTVVLDNVIEHIENPLPLMVEVKRVLSSSGRIVILVPGARGFRNDNDHKVFYDFKALESLSASSGFQVFLKKSIPISGLSNILSAFCFMIVLKC